ncbi:MAG: thrombospondin type 3 repeat-containing protein [Gemmatimonadota bacterium]
MRTLSLLSLLVIGSSAVPSPAAGQRLYRFEANGALSYNKFDTATELSSSVGFTGRLGYWFFRKVSVEVEGSFAVPKSRNGETVNVATFAAAGLYNFPLGFYNSVYLKAGYGKVGYGSCPDSIAPSKICGSSNALLAGLGVRYALSPTVLTRGEILLGNSGSSSPSFTNLSFSVGLSYMLGSKPLNDSDGDGVYDRYDRCGSTPVGAIVNSSGCPSDTDKDGILDGVDRCPNSPSGSAVDAAGCPKDSDRDGVLDGIDRCENTPAGAAVDTTGCPSDSDGDKVPDGLDRCPNTPSGATTDRLGCPGDQDNDHVFDGIDRCPNTPPGATVNSFGCPPVIDSDRDGIVDAADRCPNTPAGTTVNSFGCPPILDSDRDGAPDAADLCPGTPPNTPVDLNGCPTTPTTPAAQPVDTVRRPPTQAPEPSAGAPSPASGWTVPGNAFAIRSSTLRSVVQAQLDSIATALLARPSLKVEIGGNAQDRLPPEENLKLSTDRAQAIRLYLLGKGVRGSQLTIRGYGSTNLITQDSTDLARVRNRRTEIKPVSEP